MNKTEILPVESGDIDSIIDLLNDYNLVIQDIDLNKQIFIKASQNNELFGIGAIELYKPYGLIRSLAVSPDKTNSGLAFKIMKNLEQIAVTNQIEELYLLTETAEKYFTRLDYRSVDRENIPEEIKLTNQFSSLCPANAVVMVKSVIPLA